jgi:hypothetical protein
MKSIWTESLRAHLRNRLWFSNSTTTKIYESKIFDIPGERAKAYPVSESLKRRMEREEHRLGRRIG